MAISNSELTALLVVAENAVIAGASAMASLVDSGEQIQVHRKEDNTIVMSLDLASQDAVLKVLDKRLEIVSEERPETHSIIDRAGDYFLVDPLDGTASCQRCLRSFNSFRPGQVGFGPMVGVVSAGKLVAVAFVEVGSSLLFSASVGNGAFMREIKGGTVGSPQRLMNNNTIPLSESAMLFYPGINGEMGYVKAIREQEIVDTIYRFGGFANDCSRAARGFEQSVVQFSLKAWDLPAALIPLESGLSVVVDPVGSRTPLIDWQVARVNPVVISHAQNMSKLLGCIDCARS